MSKKDHALEKALAVFIVVGIIALVVAIHLAFIAGAIIGGYKAYVAFVDGRMGVAFGWAVLCVFCTMGVLGAAFQRARL